MHRQFGKFVFGLCFFSSSLIFAIADSPVTPSVTGAIAGGVSEGVTIASKGAGGAQAALSYGGGKSFIFGAFSTPLTMNTGSRQTFKTLTSGSDYALRGTKRVEPGLTGTGCMYGNKPYVAVGSLAANEALDWAKLCASGTGDTVYALASPVSTTCSSYSPASCPTGYGYGSTNAAAVYNTSTGAIVSIWYPGLATE